MDKTNYSRRPHPRILVSWIGTTDLASMGADLDAPGQARVCEAIRVKGPLKKQHGPIRTLLAHESFQAIHLISNFEPALNRQFAKWIEVKSTVHTVKLDNPTDYVGIFSAVQGTLNAIGDIGDAELAFFLSPGTPAMIATWILVGKSRHNVVFYQTYAGKAWQTEIPYDIVASFVPDLGSAPDSSLQHLAALPPSEIAGFEQIVGSSKALRLVTGRAAKTARRDVPVLIFGESGTGKEMFARSIHDASHRKNGPYVAINCAAIPQALLESELFGHVRGAFTGAAKDHPGAFLRGDGGTVFLDEIGECHPEMQAKLLRVLQPPPGKPPCYREFAPVGASSPIHSDARIIAATNRDLIGEINSGRFREDLYYRLAVITIKLPALRDRKTDIPALSDAILQEINSQFRNQERNYADKSLSDSAKRFVNGYDWPGNIRQLRNALLEAAVMADGDSIGAADIKAAIADVPDKRQSSLLDRPLGEGFSLQELLEDIQRHYLRRAMVEANGVKTRAAESLGLPSYQTLDAQLRRLKVTGDWKS